jgi:hypothetical protein
MANLISLIVFSPTNDPNSEGVYTSATELINVDKIQGVVASSVTSGVNASIDYSYNVGNLFQNKELLVNSSVAQVLAAANAPLA